MSYNTVYFANSLQSWGNLLWCFKQNRRVWIVFSDTVTQVVQKEILHNHHDYVGSLYHFEKKKIIYHCSYDIGNTTMISLLNPEEQFFAIICEYTEEQQNKIFNLINVCAKEEPCNKCHACKHFESLANKYGMYDVLS